MFLPVAAAACVPALSGDDVRTIEGRDHVVGWRAPQPLPLAQFFAIELAVCARDGAPVITPLVDATMPEHRHGMNYRPSVGPLGSGRFRATGLLLHMPGRWRLSFAVGSGARREALHAALIVE
jgi:hypothetical protein